LLASVFASTFICFFVCMYVCLVVLLFDFTPVITFTHIYQIA